MNVTELGVDLAKVVELAMIGKDGLLDPFQLDVLPRKKLFEGEEAWLVFGLVVVAILDLTLESSELHGLITGTGMGSIDDGVSRLDIEQVQLDGVITVNVLIREKELLSESEHNGLLYALFTQRLLSVEPVHCGITQERQDEIKHQFKEELKLKIIQVPSCSCPFRCITWAKSRLIWDII